MALNREQQGRIEWLYRKNYSILYQYAKSVLDDRSMTRDAVQETFRIACGKGDELLVSGNPAGWLMETLKNVISNIEKMERRRARIFLPSAVLEENRAASPQETLMDLDMIGPQVLGEEDYQLIKQVILGRITVREAAQALDISEAACYKRISRSKRKLKKYLEENG